MKRLRPELLPAPHMPKAIPFVIAGLIATLAIACGALVHWQRASAEVERQTLSSSVAPAPLPVSENPAAPSYASSAHELLTEHYPIWSAGLAALERAAATGVTPTSVEYVAKDRLFRVELAFADYPALLAYRERLDEGNPRTQWVLDRADTDGQVDGKGRASVRWILR